MISRIWNLLFYTLLGIGFMLSLYLILGSIIFVLGKFGMSVGEYIYNMSLEG
jgi:hypothetical protein